LILLVAGEVVAVTLLIIQTKDKVSQRQDILAVMDRQQSVARLAQGLVEHRAALEVRAARVRMVREVAAS